MVKKFRESNRGRYASRSFRAIPADTNSPNVSLNRILDNKARTLYAPAIEKLTELVPKTMSKKIAEANVQQAFVFDTVYRYLSQYQNPKLLMCRKL